MMDADVFFMREALREARKAFAAGEVPVGAVVVYEGTIIARGHNQTETLRDPTAHAEMIALTAAAHRLGNWRLNGARLYVTLEPCIMCSGAAVLARLAEIVYATEDPKFGGAVSLYRIPSDPRLNHRLPVRKGPLGEEAAALMKEFFAMLRKKNRVEQS